MRKVELPANIKTLGLSAFAGCKQLQEMILNDGLTTIESFAIGASLEEIIIPKTVTSLQAAGLFESALTLKSVKFEGDAPEDFSSDPNFQGSYTVYYHEGAKGFTSPEWCGYPTEIW